MKTEKLIIAVFLLSACGFCGAQPMSIFAEALLNGRATAPLPSDSVFNSGVQAIQSRTGKTGPVEVIAWRIERFTQQAHCGRVGFITFQPSSNTAFPEMGGELNVCEDGMPPLRLCPDIGLVPYSAKCKDGSAPSETAEVKEAIARALARGGLTREQVQKRTQSAQGEKK